MRPPLGALPLLRTVDLRPRAPALVAGQGREGLRASAREECCTPGRGRRRRACRALDGPEALRVEELLVHVAVDHITQRRKLARAVAHDVVHTLVPASQLQRLEAREGCATAQIDLRAGVHCLGEPLVGLPKVGAGASQLPARRTRCRGVANVGRGIGGNVPALACRTTRNGPRPPRFSMPPRRGQRTRPAVRAEKRARLISMRGLERLQTSITSKPMFSPSRSQSVHSTSRSCCLASCSRFFLRSWNFCTARVGSGAGPVTRGRASGTGDGRAAVFRTFASARVRSHSAARDVPRGGAGGEEGSPRARSF